MTLSIEKRVIWMFAGFTLVLSLIYFGLNILVAYVVEDDVIESFLKEEAAFIESHYNSTGELTKPHQPNFSLISHVDQLPKVIQEEFIASPNETEFFGSDGRHYHVIPLQLDDSSHRYLLAEVSEYLAVRKVSDTVAVLLGIVSFLSISFAVWIAIRIAKSTTRPIVKLAYEVKKGRECDDPLSLSVTTQDEVGFLASTIEESVNSLKESIQRETHFTRDVSHELRTPLTEAKNILALRNASTIKDAELQQVGASLDKMKNIVSTLLAMARKDELEMQELNIRPLVESLVLRNYERLISPFDIIVDMPDKFELYGNAQLVELLIQNLIENAIQYASEPWLKVSCSTGCLVFENKTNRLPETGLTQPNKKSAESKGIGQGLYIVRRISEQLEWKMQLEQVDEQFRILFDVRK